MARKVRVVTLSGEKKCYLTDKGLDNAVEEMKSYWEKRLENVFYDKPDLIVLPENCDRFLNFTKEQKMEYYRIRGDRMLDFFAEKAAEHRCYIAYASIYPEKDGKNRNSVIMIDRDGKVMGRYNKYCTTVTETDTFQGHSGKEAVIFDCDFGRVGAILCFDLNFDVIRNLYKEKKPELMIFSSAYHGSFMQNYWAYDLRSWFVSSIGGGNPSAVINPLGTKVAETSNYSKWLSCEINLDCYVAHLDYTYDEVMAAKKKYGAGFKVEDPGYLGAWLLSSEMEEVTMPQIVEEFGIEYIDHYFERSLKKADQDREK